MIMKLIRTEKSGACIQLRIVLFTVAWTTVIGSTIHKDSSEPTRTKRYLHSELIPLSRTCTVYDETLANRVLTDDSTGAICTLLSVNKMRAESSSLSISTKIISAANPLAHYFTIQPQNYSLVTAQRIDREELCAQAPNEQTTSDALIRCCTSRKRECELPLTVLVQVSRVSTSGLNVSEGQTEKQSQFMRLTVRLIDVNDNPPRFPTTRHQVVVSEGIRVGTRFPLPPAQDIDSSDYGIARYYLLSQEDDTFELEQISPVSTELKLTEKDLLTDNAYSNLAFPSNGLNNNYFGSKSPFDEASSVDLAPKQLYLKLVRQLDWEVKQSYAYVVVAEDNGSPALTGQLEIQVVVTDENDNHPTFRNKTFTLSVPENSPKGTRLIQLVAHDPDQGKAGQIVYSLAVQPGSGSTKSFESHSGTWNHRSISSAPNQSAASQLFSIDSYSGWLILNGPLDYERNKHHLVRVLAKDEAGHPGFDEATVNILVTDVNDVPPTISVDPVTDLMPQDATNSRSRTLDQPSNMLSLYVNETVRWISSEGTRHTMLINPSNVNQPLLLAFVAVRDPDTGRGGEFVCGLHQVNNEKENQLQSRGYHYSESIGKSDDIFHVRQEDLERTSPSIVGHFKLNPISASQFELSSFGGFDHEQAAVEEIQIVCMDFGQPSLVSRFTLRIHVGDLNDNAPAFAQTSYQLVVEENRPADTVLERFTATDSDSGRNAEIEYFLDNQGSEYFRIDSKDGTLYTKSSFDREVRQHYRFQVFARDHGTPTALTSTATVEVNVLDLNDNHPEFVGLDNDNCYKFRVAENEPANTHVGILLGTDNDSKDNARLKFRLVTSSGSFKLDPQTGELTTLHSLDREKQAQYELIAMLMDYGRPTLSATAKVVIYVSDVNDHDPIVVFPANGRGNVTVSFREPPGEVVARIEARDPDEGHNALLHYSLISGNRNSVFRLGSTSAELTVNHQLTETDIGIYPLEVLIQDAGIPPRSANVKLTVKVTDAPARMYSHRFGNQQSKLDSSVNQANSDGSPSVGQFRRPEGGQSNANSLDLRQVEATGSETGLVSAGAILVAIVALSCAIILVLLGITVYLCGHKGFGIRRAYDQNRGRRGRTNQANSHHHMNVNVTTDINNINNNEPIDSVIEPIKRGTLTLKSLDSDRMNSTQASYPDPILLDPGSGTLLRCQFSSIPGTTGANANEYTDQKSLRMNSPISYDAYTTCLPMTERVPISGPYEAIPAGRILFPITSGTFAGTNGTTVMVNNGEFLHPKFTSNSIITRVKPSMGPMRANKHTANKVRNQHKSMYDDRPFTQSLKLKRSEWINACESPVSEGSGTMNSEQKQTGLGQQRAAKSWETLVVVPHTRQNKWSPATRDRLQRIPDNRGTKTNTQLESKSSELSPRGDWTTLTDVGTSGREKTDSRAVSTFLRDQERVLLTPTRNQSNTHQLFVTPNTDPFCSQINRPQTEPCQDACGYSRLCKSTQLAVCARRSPNPSGLTQEVEPSRRHNPAGTTVSDLAARRTPKSENLIELLDSSQASSCSQTCDCAMFSTEHHCSVFQPLATLPSYNEQSEFV